MSAFLYKVFASTKKYLPVLTIAKLPFLVIYTEISNIS